MSRLSSCLYRGHVVHRRSTPVPHAFRYPLFLMYLDLGELDRVFRGRWLWSCRRPALAWLRRSDHLGDPRLPLEESVRRLVEARTGRRPEGPIRLLTHLRTFGHCFNPVSLFFCFDASGDRIDSLVAEVSNTPWGERHVYVLRGDGTPGDLLRAEHDKEFHVSPFMGMDLRYRWAVRRPGARLSVQVENLRGGERFFQAALSLKRVEITGWSLAAALLRYPLMTVQTVAAIYFEAMRLWLKKAPFHSHPGRAVRATEER